jgi:hypothetical protein
MVVMKNKVAYDRRYHEARESENVWNRIDVLMRGELSEDLNEGFLSPRCVCSKKWKVDSAQSSWKKGALISRD